MARDIDLTKRDLYGKVSFAIKSSEASGIERLIQKITIALLSESKQTYFGYIVGSEIGSAGNYLFNSKGDSDFRINIIDNLSVIQKKIIDDDANDGVPFSERLKKISLVDVLFDSFSKNVVLSISVESNSGVKTVKLPVK